MRNVIRRKVSAGDASHFGHAYDVLAPPPLGVGTPDVAAREAWFGHCEAIAISPDYALFYQRWKASFSDTAELHEVTAKARLLIGHGNPSGSDVGLSVHHTWGVPVLPGSALKGMLAHYVDAVYGADDPAQPGRRGWRGPTWTDRRVRQGDGAGANFAALFGGPEVDNEEGSGRRGFVEFHDALYVPDRGRELPFARDVLTVHQKPYYDSAGTAFPTDWDSPNPVGFITVRPKTRFLLALSGDGDWPKLAMTLLLAALKEWGIGGKTTAGYGRLAP
jgi:CRISPR-associated protein Cmr6